jgi:hypothetical protein
MCARAYLACAQAVLRITHPGLKLAHLWLGLNEQQLKFKDGNGKCNDNTPMWNYLFYNTANTFAPRYEPNSLQEIFYQSYSQDLWEHGSLLSLKVVLMQYSYNSNDVRLLLYWPNTSPIRIRTGRVGDFQSGWLPFFNFSLVLRFIGRMHFPSAQSCKHLCD